MPTAFVDFGWRVPRFPKSEIQLVRASDGADNFDVVYIKADADKTHHAKYDVGCVSSVLHLKETAPCDFYTNLIKNFKMSQQSRSNIKR